MVLYPRYPDPYGLRPYEFKDEKERERWIFITIFLVGIPAILLVIFLVYMNTVDYKMSPEKPQFQIDSASVSGVSVTGSQLAATWNITLLAANPNRHLGVDYMTMEASLYYGDKNDVVSPILLRQGEPDQTCQFQTRSSVPGRRLWRGQGNLRGSGSSWLGQIRAEDQALV
ncbi:hypothetical protein M0R45_029644 [Rubus argutus]|uniref:Late embryogenesis abundant protein LEA-2 subgroup domain-containing protein n=1 Tax=Rubus argutus TaxID=59490 RepID=A0AAW1WBC9_RUBAR